MTKDKMIHDVLVLCDWLKNCVLSNFLWVVVNLSTLFWGYQLFHASDWQLFYMSSIFLFGTCLLILVPSIGFLALFCKDWREGISVGGLTHFKQVARICWQNKWTFLIINLLVINLVSYLKLSSQTILFQPLIIIALAILFVGVIVFFINQRNGLHSMNFLQAVSQVLLNFPRLLKLMILYFIAISMSFLGIQFVVILFLATILMRLTVSEISRFR